MMKRSKITLIVTAAAIMLPLASCNQEAKKPENQGAAVDKARPVAPSPTAQLLAAAEPFEKLTETAFTAPLAELDKTVLEARTAGIDVKALLSAEASRRMDGLLADIKDKRQKEERAAIALSSIEIYRLIVSAVPGDAPVPVEVSLLDYAGFRYQADLKSSPVRWADMAEAVRFARAQWSKVTPRVAAPNLAAKVEKSLSDMERAAQARQQEAAAAAVVIELDSVDLLEGYFQRK